LRKDLPKGTIRRVVFLDTYPFVDSAEKVQLSGEYLPEALEQSLIFEREILQVSGKVLHYDLQQPIGSRLVSAKLKGIEIKSDQLLTVSMATFLAEGGDLCTSLPKGKRLQTCGKISTEIIDYFKRQSPINLPNGNRQIAEN
jgi:2',3'-cyclic-nucleotide 2'-phosphodiesterase (5'-nucleotidase family)